MFSKALIATLLAGTAAATPIATRSTGAFGLVALKTGSSLQFSSIVANGGQLWIGKETASYCPESVGAACPGNSNYSQHGKQKLTAEQPVTRPHSPLVRTQTLE
jgi:hypothetical protein